MPDACPCGSGKAFTGCCGPFLDRKLAAPTAETLMRSRYTAFVRNDTGYLERTLLPRKRSTFNAQATREWNGDVVWKGLRIVATTGGGEKDTEGVVEFIASFVKAGEPHDLHEISRFRKKGDSWFYVDDADGTVPSADAPSVAKPKVGRNAPCPCGSGKKYKHCCGA